MTTPAPQLPPELETQAREAARIVYYDDPGPDGSAELFVEICKSAYTAGLLAGQAERDKLAAILAEYRKFVGAR